MWNTYINTTIQPNNNFLSIGIASDITLGYRGLELNELMVMSDMDDCRKGDFNHDGMVDVTDIVPMVNYITLYTNLSGFQYCASDANDDGYIDVLDIIIFINYILEN